MTIIGLHGGDVLVVRVPVAEVAVDLLESCESRDVAR